MTAMEIDLLWNIVILFVMVIYCADVLGKPR
jgi:hypothetical protein